MLSYIPIIHKVTVSWKGNDCLKAYGAFGWLLMGRTKWRLLQLLNFRGLKLFFNQWIRELVHQVLRLPIQLPGFGYTAFSNIHGTFTNWSSLDSFLVLGWERHVPDVHNTIISAGKNCRYRKAQHLVLRSSLEFINEVTLPAAQSRVKSSGSLWKTNGIWNIIPSFCSVRQPYHDCCSGVGVHHSFRSKMKFDCSSNFAVCIFFMRLIVSNIVLSTYRGRPCSVLIFSFSSQQI